MFLNLSPVDRCFRAILGLLFISQVFIGVTTPFGWIGGLFLLSAFFGFCPAYRAMQRKGKE